MKTKNYKGISLTAAAVFAVVAMVSWNNRSHGQSEPPMADDILLVRDVPEGWKSLFDGETLTGWKNVNKGGEDQPFIRNGALVLPIGTYGIMTGLYWVGDSLPACNYVVYYEARRIAGNDIFAALTFPYKDTYGSLIFGGWGGIVNGLSSIGGFDASENETTQFFSLRNNQWYPVMLRVTNDSIRAIVASEEVIDIATAGKDIHLRSDILDTGFTLWTYRSSGEIRNLRFKKID